MWLITSHQIWAFCLPVSFRPFRDFFALGITPFRYPLHSASKQWMWGFTAKGHSKPIGWFRRDFSYPQSSYVTSTNLEWTEARGGTSSSTKSVRTGLTRQDMPYDEVCPPNFVKFAPPRARPQYKSSSNDTVVCEYWNTWGQRTTKQS